MKISGLVLLTLLASTGIAEKGGFYSVKETETYLKNLTETYKNYVRYSESFLGNSAIRTYNREKEDKILRQVLVFGGLYGSLTATAQVLSFATNYCKFSRRTDIYQYLLENFEIVFLPIANKVAYEEAYNKKDDSNQDDSIEVSYDEVRTNLMQQYTNATKTFLAISIQGKGSDIIAGRTDSKKLTDEQKYEYKILTGTTKYRTPDENSGDLFNNALDSGKYVVQYEHEAKTKLVRENLDDEFEKEFSEVFDRLNTAFAKPYIIFDKAIENKDPTEEKPSIITFYLNITNNYFFSIKTNVRFNLTLNYQDKYRKLEFFRVGAKYSNLYDDSDIIIGDTIGEANITLVDYDIPFYQVTIEDFEFNSLSKYIFKIQFNRTVGGSIKFDADVELEQTDFYLTQVKSFNKGYKVTLKSNSDSHNKAPKQVVLFIMILVFLLIILVIICNFLVNKKSYKSLS